MTDDVVRKHPLAKCEICPLYDATYVPSRGSDTPDILFVGEAPGSNEAIQGKPFIGKSGRFLDSAITQIIDPSRLRYTNAVGCHPTGNATPSKATVFACRDRLLDEINTTRPKVIVPVGGVSLLSIHGTPKKITAERGKATEVNGFTIIPTWHPSYVQNYNPSAIGDFLSDLEKAVAYVNGTQEAARPEPRVSVYDSPRTALAALYRISQHSIVNVDIETDSELGDIRFESDPVLCVSFSFGDGSEAYVIGYNALRASNVIDALKRLLERTDIEFEWQNGKFDCKFFRAQYDIRARVDFDTMLAHYCLDERKGIHDLKQMAERYEGAPDYEKELKKTIRGSVRYGKYPRPALYKYGGYDTAYGRRLGMRFRTLLAEQGLERLHAFMIETTETLMQMEMHGVLIDRARIETLDRELREEMKAALVAVEKAAGEPLNPHATEKLSRKLFSELKLRPPKKAKKGKKGLWSTAKDVLKEMTDQHPLPGAVLTYRSLQKLHATYTVGLTRGLRRGDRYWPDHRQHGTVTSRLSGPLTLVMPKPAPGKPNIRALVIEPPKMLLVEADHSQGELRVAAAMSREPLWVDIFRRGGDIHFEMQKILPGMGTMDDAIEQCNGDVSDGEKLYEIWRRNTKTVNFGALYGMEEWKLADMFNWPLWQARNFLKEYWLRVPTLKKWIESVQEEALRTGRLVSPYGHVRRYGLITDEVRKSVMKEASNYYPQNILNNINLDAANKLRDPIRTVGSELVLVVHDAIVAEVPEGREHEAGRMMTQQMVQSAYDVFGDSIIPFMADIKVGKNWGEMRKLKLD